MITVQPQVKVKPLFSSNRKSNLASGKVVDPSSLTKIKVEEDLHVAEPVLGDIVEDEDIMKDDNMMMELESMIKDILGEEVVDNQTVDLRTNPKIVSEDKLR